MHVWESLYYIFVTSVLLRHTYAKRSHRELAGEYGALVERQAGDAAGSSAGNSGAIPDTTTQTQNLTNTAGSTTSPENSTSSEVPGYITQATNGNNGMVNCSDITTGRANKCWEELGLTQWVQDWSDTHKCYEEEGFSTCYLRQNGFPGLDCSQIAVSSCVAPQGDELLQYPENFYVAYNIYAVNQFFYSWWTAVGDSGGIASDNIGSIVQIIDIPSSTPVVLQDILLALQAVFALIPGPLGIYAAHSGFSFTWQASAQVISNALNALPNIGRFLFPVDTAASQTVQIADLSANFGQILQQVQGNLNQTLTSVMANETEFLAFASQGNFSELPPSLPDQANYLYFAFNTYLISAALSGNNVYGVIGRETNPQELDTNGTKLNYNIDCKGYDEQNVCDAWWYSGNYNSAFTLDDFSHMNRNYGTQISNLLQNLTTGELLFEGALACNAEGNFGQPVNITVNAGGVNTACISQLRVLTWDMGCTDPSGTCEFLETSRQETFLFGNAHAMTDQSIRSVPAGYLGPLLTQTKQKIWRD